jgi:hypothetical protein
VCTGVVTSGLLRRIRAAGGDVADSEWRALLFAASGRFASSVVACRLEFELGYSQLLLCTVLDCFIYILKFKIKDVEIALEHLQEFAKLSFVELFA